MIPGDTRFPALTHLLCGPAAKLADPLEPLCRSLSEQARRRGPGSDIAAAKLEGIRCAQLRGRA